MSGINFLSDNHMDNSTISITSGTANSQYPLSNLLNDSPSIKFQSVGSTVTILIDMITTRDVDTIALVGDPTGTLGIISAVFKSSTTTDFSLSTPINITLSAEFNMGLEYVTEVSDRYWQIELTGATYCELGNVFIGKRLNLPQNSISIGSFAYGHKDRSTVEENEYGQKFIDKRNLVQTLGGSIEYCTKDETQDLDDMYKFHGISRPLWIILDKNSEAMNDGEFRLTMYGYLTGEFNWKANGGQLYTSSISMVQAI